MRRDLASSELSASSLLFQAKRQKEPRRVIGPRPTKSFTNNNAYIFLIEDIVFDTIFLNVFSFFPCIEKSLIMEDFFEISPSAMGPGTTKCFGARPGGWLSMTLSETLGLFAPFEGIQNFVIKASLRAERQFRFPEKKKDLGNQRN